MSLILTLIWFILIKELNEYEVSSKQQTFYCKDKSFNKTFFSFFRHLDFILDHLCGV